MIAFVFVSIIAFLTIYLSVIVYNHDKEEIEEGRTFQGMDVEEYIKKEVGEEYYNKHYKKNKK